MNAPRSQVARAASHPDPFDALFDAEYGRVIAIASRILGDPHAAEDVAQDVFLSLHRRGAAGARYAPAWLHVAAAHAALNALRARRRRARREQLWSAGVAPAADPAEDAATNEALVRLRDAMSRLKRTHATVLALRYSGLSYAECADALGVRINHVGTMLRRAEAALRKELGDAPV